MAPDPDRQFTLKQAEIAVFNRNVWDLLWDFTVVADMAKVDYLFIFKLYMKASSFSLNNSTYLQIVHEGRKLCGWQMKW